MKKTVPLLAVLWIFAPATYACAPHAKWKIDSFSLSKISVWNQVQAEKLVGQTLSRDEHNFALEQSQCNGHGELKSETESKELLEGISPAICGEKLIDHPVFAVNYECKDKDSQFAPYFVPLSNGKALAFGDGIEICLSPLADLEKSK